MYAIKINGQYVHGIEANEHYCPSGTAPTTGTRFSYNEFKTICGDEPKPIEPLTVASYLKTLFEEHRWGGRKPEKIEVIPYTE